MHDVAAHRRALRQNHLAREDLAVDFAHDAGEFADHAALDHRMRADREGRGLHIAMHGAFDLDVAVGQHVAEHPHVVADDRWRRGVGFGLTIL